MSLILAYKNIYTKLTLLEILFPEYARNVEKYKIVAFLPAVTRFAIYRTLPTNCEPYMLNSSRWLRGAQGGF